MTIQMKAWSVTEADFSPQKLHHLETIFTIGNGYLSTRGAFEEGYPGDSRATLVHGVFDDVPLVFTELANAPDWLPIYILADGERFSLSEGKVIHFERSLDLQTGLLTRKLKWISPSGKGISLVYERFASLADEHLLCQRCVVTADFDGELEIDVSLEGNTENYGFAHWRWVKQGLTPDGIIYLHSQTRTTTIDLALAMRLHTSRQPEKEAYCNTVNVPTRTLIFTVRSGETITLEKYVGIATSRDTPDPTGMAVEHALKSPGWKAAFEDQQQAWQAEWKRMDIVIEGDDEAQLAVRSSIYQLLIAAPRHDDRVNIGAKTLSGFGYRGHSFWDTEIFMLPVFIYTSPQIARNLLNYRYQRLEAAREKARQNGYEGAQFPWESADSGKEVTPTWLPNFSDPTGLVRIWTGDIEIHISADISYATYLYWKTTGDDAWLIDCGAEMILDTAKFWASRAEWNPDTGKYEYNNVIGPDEYHDHVDDNFYTNYMARWNLKTALEILDWLNIHASDKASELTKKLELTADRINDWNHVIEHINLPIQPDGLIEQFEGYFKRKDIDLAALEPRRISAQVYFGIEGCNETQVLKQPDVLMLMYLLPDEFEPSQMRVNYDYYTPRTDISYGSSLGPSIQAVMTCRIRNPETAYEYFIRAARADLLDVRGNASDGIHGASAGGTWQAVVFGFAGLHIDHDGWEVNPCMPAHWKRLRFHFIYCGQVQTVDIQNP